MTLLAPAILVTLAARFSGWWSIPLIVVAAFCLLSAFTPKLEA